MDMWGGTSASISMNFRLVWMGPDDDPETTREIRTEEAPRRLSTSLPHYEQRGTEMVRHEILRNGSLKTTLLANFQARLIRDLVIDDGVQERREFGIEAEVGGTR